MAPAVALTSSLATSTQNLVPPVHNLPNEILLHIFSLGSRDDPTDDVSHREAFLLAVTAVCVRWRDVGVSFPLFWRSIKVTLSLRPPARSERYLLEKIPKFLERSRDVSLDLDIYVEEGGDMWDKVMDIIVPHLQRCRFIELDFPREDLKMISRIFPLPRMERLASLAIFASRPSRRQWPPTFSPVLPLFQPENTSPLTKLSIYGIPPSFFTIDARQAHSISPSVLEFLDLTASIQNPLILLEVHSVSLTLLALSFSAIGHWPSMPIHLPRLLILKVTQGCLAIIQEFIHCPALEELTLSSDLSNGEIEADTSYPIASAIQTLLSWNQLRVLALEFVDTHNDQAIQDIIAAARTITALIMLKDGFRPDPDPVEGPGLSIFALLTNKPHIVPNLNLVCLKRISGFAYVSPYTLHDLQGMWAVRPALHVECSPKAVSLGGLDFDAFKEIAQGRFSFGE